MTFLDFLFYLLLSQSMGSCETSNMEAFGVTLQALGLAYQQLGMLTAALKVISHLLGWLC